MLGLAALSVASCSDTWDEHYESVSGSVVTRTLWDIISTHDSLSNFAELAQSVHYYRDETHPQADYTFQRMLDGTQLITAWVPTNGALDKAEWERLKELAQTNPYTVQQQLLANSIALWRQVASSAGVDTITLLNGKKQAFDKSSLTMAGIPLIEKNIAATNGTLHVIGQSIPFAYNLYEYVKDAANTQRIGASEFNEFVMDNDTTYFNESGSIEGIPDADGMPTYIDSSYVTSNNLFFSQFRYPENMNTERFDTYDEGFAAQISAEDSSFIMLIPTDQALDAAKEMLKPYYKYAPEYLDASKGNNGTYVVRELTGTADSLMEKSIRMDLFSPLVFNVNLQPNAAGRIGRWNIEDLLNNVEQATYLRNTFGDTLRSDDTWRKEVLFAGNRVKMSNGYGVLTDSWNFPSKFYKPDLEIEATYDRIFDANRFTTNNNSWETIGFSNEVAANWIDSVGRVSNDNFMRLTPNNPNSGFTGGGMEFILRGSQQETYDAEVMSGKYDIYVVMVPSFYATSADTIYGEIKKSKIRATINYNLKARPTTGNNAGTAVSSDRKQLETVTYAGEKVDTLLLAEDFEFPHSYKNLIHCYPTITIQGAANRNDVTKNGFTNTLYIDRIILKSKD